MRKNKSFISWLSSVEFAKRVLKIKMKHMYYNIFFYGEIRKNVFLIEKCSSGRVSASGSHVRFELEADIS